MIRSLPLMGIGNRDRHTRRTTFRTAHYPSWGSGTVAIARILSPDG